MAGLGSFLFFGGSGFRFRNCLVCGTTKAQPCSVARMYPVRGCGFARRFVFVLTKTTRLHRRIFGSQARGTTQTAMMSLPVAAAELGNFAQRFTCRDGPR